MIDDSWYKRPEGVDESIAAGGVVVRVERDRIYVAAAVEKGFDTYVLPKGHVDPGEDVEAAARREIAEEVGVQSMTLIDDLGTWERLDFGKTEWKITHYYLYLTQERDVKPLEADVHTEMKWLSLEETETLFWPEQRQLITDHKDRVVEKVRAAASSAVDAT